MFTYLGLDSSYYITSVFMTCGYVKSMDSRFRGSPNDIKKWGGVVKKCGGI